MQEDTTLTESRPSTAVQTGVGGDPLSLDVDDLYVKFKVRTKIIFYYSISLLEQTLKSKVSDSSSVHNTLSESDVVIDR